jgi:hypothetical protein
VKTNKMQPSIGYFRQMIKNANKQLPLLSFADAQRAVIQRETVFTAMRKFQRAYSSGDSLLLQDAFRFCKDHCIPTNDTSGRAGSTWNVDRIESNAKAFGIRAVFGHGRKVSESRGIRKRTISHGFSVAHASQDMRKQLTARHGASHPIQYAVKADVLLAGGSTLLDTAKEPKDKARAKRMLTRGAKLGNLAVTAVIAQETPLRLPVPIGTTHKKPDTLCGDKKPSSEQDIKAFLRAMRKRILKPATTAKTL